MVGCVGWVGLEELGLEGQLRTIYGSMRVFEVDAPRDTKSSWLCEGRLTIPNETTIPSNKPSF